MRVVQVLLALGGAYIVATWFVLAVWTFRDIESRSRNILTQVFSTLLAVFFWVPGVLLYMILRPKETLDEAYQRSLEEEYLLQDLQELPLCPNCNHFVHDEWQICPNCNTQLREACDNCGHLVDLRWDICPYCGQDQEGKPHEHVQVATGTQAQEWSDPASIEQRILRESSSRLQALPNPNDQYRPQTDHYTVSMPHPGEHVFAETPDYGGTTRTYTAVGEHEASSNANDDDASAETRRGA